MNKLTSFIILALFATAAFAGVEANVGFKSKVVEQGVVTGNNLIVAGVNAEVFGILAGVNTFSTYEASGAGKNVASSGIFKRVDVSAGYKFTSALADLTLGLTYKNASKTAAFNGVKNNLTPSLTLGGTNWDVTASNDTKNRTNNYQGNLRLPLPVGVKDLRVVPAFGIGFNDPGAATIAALKDVKKYYNGGLGLAYRALGGVVSANVFVHRADLTSNAGQITGYDVGYKLKF